jgi:hypothetical protein
MAMTRVQAKICGKCGREFTGTNEHGRESWRRRKFCSVACKADAQRGVTRKEWLTKVCAQCGGKFQIPAASGAAYIEKRKHCSRKCKYASDRGKIAWNKGIKEDLATRFMKHVVVDHETGCWNWTGTKNRAGYGSIQVNQYKRFAHRVSWEIHKGAIPPAEGYHGHVVCHRCDNPPCVNPEHLFLGTQYTNMKDRDSKGRRVAAVGSSHAMSKLTEVDVRAIRAMAETGRVSQFELARSFKVSRGMISLVVNRKNWKHI